MSESPAMDFAPILAGETASASIWSLPNFDAAMRPRPAPPTARELESIEAAAFREGQARGHAEGLVQGRAAAKAEVSKLRELLAHLQQPLAELDAESERAMVALMLELARRLAQQELALDPSRLAAVVRDAVGHLAQPVRGVRVRLNPEDARVVALHLEPQEAGEEWRVVPDATLMPGDCVVETENARVDARLDTRQASLANRLLGEGA